MNRSQKMTLGNYFNSKRILITGASSGIGAELAVQLSKLGASLILTGRNQERLAEVRSRCRGTTETIWGDLLQTDVIERIRTACDDGDLDLAILNAGTAHYENAGVFKAETFNVLIQSNLVTMVNCVEAVIPSLIRCKGQLALMSSLAGYGGFPQSSGYGAGKAAIRNLAQSLDLDLRPVGVPVSCVCPGFIKTPLTDQNRFKMPFLMDCEAAAEVILNGLQSQRHEIHFPKRLSLLLKFVMSLPASWQYRLLLRTTRSLSL